MITMMRRIGVLAILAAVLFGAAAPADAWWRGGRVGVVVGVGPGFWGWGWGPWWGVPPVVVAPPVFAQPPVVSVDQFPPVWVQQDVASQQQSFWYFCEGAQAYYPYVRECPGGWMKVVPPSGPPGGPGGPAPMPRQ